MCGLVAILKQDDAVLDTAVLQRMTDALQHRGPDRYGYAFSGPRSEFVWTSGSPPEIAAPGLAMGHRRLKIIDLSDAGHQPFVSADRRHWLIYNGEIYNYLELRAELEGLGCVLRTHSDTEVLLEAYRKWGVEAFNRFNGMWAFIIWDAAERQLIACRDRFGVKPLYFTRAGGDWLFASEIKALLRHPRVSAVPDERAIFNLLTRNALPSQDKTLYESINAVEPGTFLTVRNGSARVQRYWKLPESTGEPLSNLNEAVERFRDIFTDAVRLRLRSDVRVGTMLSGGLDSTSVITTIAGLLGEEDQARRAIGSRLQGFNATFPGETIDETGKVDELCAALNVNAHKIYPNSEPDPEALLREVMHQLEMPFNSSIPMVNTLLMRRARSTGVTVVLNGHGADEIFAGYPSEHCAVAAADELRRGHFRGCYREMQGMVRLHGHSWKWAAALTLEHLLARRLIRDNPDSDQRLIDYYFDPDQLRTQVPPNPGRTRKSGRTELDRMLKYQLFDEILPRWLQMEDRTSMSASVEARLPFLDYRLVEFAFTLDNTLKVRGGHTKFVMREAMSGRLPDSIVRDTQKFYFPGPNVHWLKGPLKNLLASSLTGPGSLTSRFTNKERVAQMISEFHGGAHGKNRLLWRLLNTEMWMRAYFA